MRYHFYLENHLIQKEETDVVGFGLHPFEKGLATMKMEHRIPASCRFFVYPSKTTWDEKKNCFISPVSLCFYSLLCCCIDSLLQEEGQQALLSGVLQL